MEKETFITALRVQLKSRYAKRDELNESIERLENARDNANDRIVELREQRSVIVDQIDAAYILIRGEE